MEEAGAGGLTAQGLLSTWHSYRLVVVIIALAAVVIRRTWLSQRKAASRAAGAGEGTLPSAQPSSTEKFTGGGSDDGRRTVPYAQWNTTKPKQQAPAAPKKVHGVKPAKKSSPPPSGLSADDSNRAGTPTRLRPIVFFSSLTGTTEDYAKNTFSDRLRSAAQLHNNALLEPHVHDLSYIDFDDFFISPPKQDANTLLVYCIILPTYNIDTIINNFLVHLEETHHDFRIDTAPLSKLGGYAVFGLGDREGWPTEEEGFCSQAKEVDKWMAKLTARKRVYPLGMGDVKSDARSALGEWADGLCEVMQDMVKNGGGLGEGVAGSGDPIESDEEDVDEEDEEGSSQKAKTKKKRKQDAPVTDLEDIKFNPSKSNTEAATDQSDLPVDFTTYSKSRSPPNQQQQQQPAKEMVPTTSPTHAALTKQGYTIVGSHSGVKICRWTKSALRGRGSCYKNSFYGIKSHLCMETTPSLSCSNKCVFCWRHGTNPVGTTWRWKVDPPDLIFDGVKEGHYKKIKMMRGVPGVRAERFAEAMRIRHCALSLVGEPIFYPHINEFVGMLHNERISSFLVCNAQHPDHLAALHRVTQLYVSIDASNRDSLRKIDRPLHRDFWERFQRCLDIIREKQYFHRTVYRLTLVKGFNVEDEVMGYANLVERGLPCFVEIKGVTYCGTSSSAGAGLSMKNVPFYEEVTTFATALDVELQRRGLAYGIAAEHAHSCCILLASRRFYVDEQWHTKINYERFFELLERENAEGVSFRPEDYMAATDEWALWGNGGFDPNDTRVYRKRKGKAEGGDTAAPNAKPAVEPAVVEI